jgi:hypothetical protein
MALLAETALLIALVGGSNDSQSVSATAGTPQTAARLAARFAYLSTHGNSSCSPAFLASIASMRDDARLRGSCCSPMSLPRYRKQIGGLKKYRNVSEIPRDPYDIRAGLAKKLLRFEGLKLSPKQRSAYHYAMRHAEDRGPCCCPCWRWHVYGGLARHLIKSHGFTGHKIVSVWNLSSGCGGQD